MKNSSEIVKRWGKDKEVEEDAGEEEGEKMEVLQTLIDDEKALQKSYC